MSSLDKNVKKMSVTKINRFFFKTRALCSGPRFLSVFCERKLPKSILDILKMSILNKICKCPKYRKNLVKDHVPLPIVRLPASPLANPIVWEIQRSLQESLAYVQGP